MEKEIIQSDNHTSENKKDSVLETVFEFVEIALLALIMVAVLFAFFIRIVGVEGGSMESTLQEGDRLVLSKIFYTPERGDIVVINREGDTPLIKRIIGIGGDTVRIDEINNQVYVNEVAINEDYLDDDCVTQLKLMQGTVNVPEGYVFVLGDNRIVSLDSRMPSLLGCNNINGCVSEDLILGKAVLRFLPFNKFGSV